MKLSNAALGLAAVGAGLVVARMLSRTRGDLAPAAEPPPPDQLIGAPRAHLSATEAAQVFQADPDRQH
jgi:hypothetical protein